MVSDMIIRLLSEIVSAAMVSTDEPMSRHTTFRIGGPADVLVEPVGTGQIIAVVKLLKQMQVPFFILGNGSNILVGDKGIRGVVVKIGNASADYSVNDTVLTAGCGIKLSKLANTAYANALTGLEFAAGIPGTLGGALYMNAGAYGGEMKQVVEEVRYLDTSGNLQALPGSKCKFGYRSSIFAKEDGAVILEATLRLQEGNKDEIKAQMDDLAKRRSDKQPLNLPSAGSTFKRPEGAFAGKLIQDCGLMGFRVGGASVSEKHAGFVVNDKGATASDVRKLIETVQEKVELETGYKLLPEVKFVGEFA